MKVIFSAFSSPVFKTRVSLKYKKPLILKYPASKAFLAGKSTTVREVAGSNPGRTTTQGL